MSFLKIKPLFSILIPVLALLFLSCSGEPPELNQTWWQLNVSVDSEGNWQGQSLSLFVNGSDKDGADDLDKLYLINDKHRLFWEIPSDIWAKFSDKGADWVGINGLKAPGDGVFPDGDYRILLEDKGGERVEKKIYLKSDIPPEKQILIPHIEYDRNGVTVDNQYRLYQFWFYNEAGELVEKSPAVQAGRYNWNNLVKNIGRRSVSFSLYTEPDSGAWGLIAGPYSIRSDVP